ncbi:transcription factor S [Nematocida sp. AWRm80]|nr:transcription factor S [Nematocida sp. AWRm80]
MNSVSIDIICGSSVFRCEECDYSKEIPGIFRVKTEVQPKTKQVAKTNKELPERTVFCPECNNPKAYYYQMQTRSADEPMTIFNTCTKCKNVWRE